MDVRGVRLTILVFAILVPLLPSCGGSSGGGGGDGNPLVAGGCDGAAGIAGDWTVTFTNRQTLETQTEVYRVETQGSLACLHYDCSSPPACTDLTQDCNFISTNTESGSFGGCTETVQITISGRFQARSETISGTRTTTVTFTGVCPYQNYQVVEDMAGAKCVDCWPCGGAPIGAPTLLAPPNESVFDHYPRTTMLEWSAVSGATAYDVEVDFGWNCSGEFTCSSWANGQWVRVTTTSFTFEFGGGQPGRWRVRSVFGLDVGAFSSYRYFRYTQ